MAVKVIYDGEKLIADIRHYLEGKSDKTIDSEILRPILVRNRMDVIHC